MILFWLFALILIVVTLAFVVPPLLGAGRGDAGAARESRHLTLYRSRIAALDEERFLVLPHPVVEEYMRRKAGDYDRWLRGMRRLQSQFIG